MQKRRPYVVAGRSSVDLTKAVSQLAEHLGIRTLLLEGGGHINGAFLQPGLVNEVSLLLVPGIDGRHEILAVFRQCKPIKEEGHCPQAQVRRKAPRGYALASVRGDSGQDGAAEKQRNGVALEKAAWNSQRLSETDSG